MFERTEAQSVAWRMFAAFTFVVAFPVALEGLRFDVGWPWLNPSSEWSG